MESMGTIHLDFLKKEKVLMAKGWDGANPAGVMFLENYCFCFICSSTEDIRLFHTKDDNHIAVCKKHADELSNDWHGCGCGA